MSLVKKMGDPKVYELDGSMLTHIPDAATFNSKGFDWNDIVEINATEFASYVVSGTGTPAAEVSGIPTGYKFSKRLQYNDEGDDVKYLQIFLKSQGSGIYPEGITSGWFGPLTKKAVIRFQEAHFEDILTPWGFLKGTGIAGKTTIQKINEILGR